MSTGDSRRSNTDGVLWTNMFTIGLVTSDVWFSDVRDLSVEVRTRIEGYLTCDPECYVYDLWCLEVSGVWVQILKRISVLHL